jgi:hypothetical protein
LFSSGEIAGIIAITADIVMIELPNEVEKVHRVSLRKCFAEAFSDLSALDDMDEVSAVIVHRGGNGRR